MKTVKQLKLEYFRHIIRKQRRLEKDINEATNNTGMRRMCKVQHQK